MTMNDTQQMFKAIINGQHALKQILVNRIEKVEKKVDKLDKKIDTVEKNLTSRIDKLGKQLAYIEDDTPTRDEFNTLENRISTVEEKIRPTL